MYESGAKGGRPSIAPEKLIRALLLQVLYSIRSEMHADGASLLQHAVSLVCRLGKNDIESARIKEIQHQIGAPKIGVAVVWKATVAPGGGYFHSLLEAVSRQCLMFSAIHLFSPFL